MMLAIQRAIPAPADDDDDSAIMSMQQHRDMAERTAKFYVRLFKKSTNLLLDVANLLDEETAKIVVDHYRSTIVRGSPGQRNSCGVDGGPVRRGCGQPTLYMVASAVLECSKFSYDTEHTPQLQHAEAYYEGLLRLVEKSEGAHSLNKAHAPEFRKQGWCSGQLRGSFKECFQTLSHCVLAATCGIPESQGEADGEVDDNAAPTLSNLANSKHDMTLYMTAVRESACSFDGYVNSCEEYPNNPGNMVFPVAPAVDFGIDNALNKLFTCYSEWLKTLTVRRDREEFQECCSRLVDLTLCVSKRSRKYVSSYCLRHKQRPLLWDGVVVGENLAREAAAKPCVVMLKDLKKLDRFYFAKVEKVATDIHRERLRPIWAFATQSGPEYALVNDIDLVVPGAVGSISATRAQLDAVKAADEGFGRLREFTPTEGGSATSLASYKELDKLVV